MHLNHTSFWWFDKQHSPALLACGVREVPYWVFVRSRYFEKCPIRSRHLRSMTVVVRSPLGSAAPTIHRWP